MFLIFWDNKTFPEKGNNLVKNGMYTNAIRFVAFVPYKHLAF
jgi:hypothetical protein